MVASGAAGVKTITISGGLPLGLTGAVSHTLRWRDGLRGANDRDVRGRRLRHHPGGLGLHLHRGRLARNVGGRLGWRRGGRHHAIGDAAGDLAVGTGANTAARLAAGATSGHVLTSNGSGAAPSWQAAAGGGASWTQGISESGASFANFTANSGTWSSNGTEIIQTATTGVTRRARHNTLVPGALIWLLETELYFVSTTAGNVRAGLLVGDPADAGHMWVYVERLGTGQVAVERESSAQIKTYATTVAHSTWYKLRVGYNGVTVTTWLSRDRDSDRVADSDSVTVV